MSTLRLGPILTLRSLAARLTRRTKTYFIAHAYSDVETKSLLLDNLPAWIVPRIFPPITVSPDEHVSDSLIEAIESSDGLIYLDSQISRSSFWPTFERRFASRIGKSVLTFNPDTMRLEDGYVGSSLPVAPLWSGVVPEDLGRSHEVIRWLERARGADAKHYKKGEQSAYYGETPWSLKAKRGYGAPIALFVSTLACQSEWPFDDADYLELEQDHAVHTNNTVVAWFDTPDPGKIAAAFERLGEIPVNCCFRELVMRSATSPEPLVLVQQGQIDRRRVDDLLVRLEYAAFQLKASALPTPEQIEMREALKEERRNFNRMMGV